MSKETIPGDRIVQSIHWIRGQKVLLNSDLALLYGVATKMLNQAVKRNRERFPDDFMFQLFTEQDIAMLSRVLNSDRAIKGNIAIMGTFVKLRQTLETNRELAQKFSELERCVGEHDEEIGAILEALRRLMAQPEKSHREIGFHVRENAPRYRVRTRA